MNKKVFSNKENLYDVIFTISVGDGACGAYIIDYESELQSFDGSKFINAYYVKLPSLTSKSA